MRVRPHISASLLLVCALSVARGANADAGATAAAQGLFEEARQLMAKGQFSDACPKLEESQRLDPGEGTQFNLARCYEGLGRVASAWALYLEVAEGAHSRGQADREKVSRQHANALAKRVSRLTIHVPDGMLPGIEVTRDGQTVGRGQWGAAVPADPGTHAIAAAAPGRRPFRATVVLAEGATVETSAGPLEPAPVEPPAANQVMPPPPDLAPAPPSAERPHGSVQRTLALTAGAVGVAGLAAGTVFGLMSKSKRDDASAFCNSGNVCNDPAGPALRHDAVRDGNLSTAFFGVGIAGLAAGAVLWFTSGSDERARAGWRVTPMVSGRAPALALDGRF